MDRPGRDRSLFFPILLIGVGAVWLLVNFNIIPADNLRLLFRLWPLLLIAGGLDLLIGRGSALIGALIGLLTVGVAVGLLVAGPQLGLVRAPELQSETLTVPLDGAQSATVTLDLSRYPTTITAGGDSGNLVEANLTSFGQARLNASGQAQRQVTLTYDEGPDFFLNFLDPTVRWEIALSPQVPLALRVDGGSGAVDLDLDGLQLTDFTLDSGSGAVNLSLPNTGDAYTAQIESGSGAVNVSVAEGAAVTLELDSGSGHVNIDVPGSAALRVEVRDSGSGSVSLPSGLTVIETGDDDEGIWETAGFASAEAQVIIIVNDLGSGNVRVN